MMGKRCAIFGASGGIGSALVRNLAGRGDVDRVYAAARKPGAESDDRIRPVPMDLGDETSIADAAADMAADGPLDLVIVASGLLQREPDVAPEKSWRAIDAAAMEEVFRVNTIGPALVGKHVLEHLNTGGRPVFAAISARVGSVEDNRLGGWHSYRASKAALNQIMRNFAIELGRRNKAAIAVSLHPGTVDTSLSEPFQSGVPEGKLFTPDYSAQCLLSVIDGLDAKDNGGFFAWDGKPIPF
jgi:NAD(P)-dependent dehydrogenase (short-subunit alcohol dehydrogenase family)